MAEDCLASETLPGRSRKEVRRTSDQFEAHLRTCTCHLRWQELQFAQTESDNIGYLLQIKVNSKYSIKIMKQLSMNTTEIL